MIKTEKLEDILHREEMAELQREIDELPDYYTENEVEFINACYGFKSLDLVGSPPHLTQTMWKEKLLMPASILNIYTERKKDLKYLLIAYYIFGALCLSFSLLLLWYISSSY